MTAAKGEEGEEFANIIHVEVNCKLFFFKKAGQSWKIPTLIILYKEFTSNQKLAT